MGAEACWSFLFPAEPDELIYERNCPNVYKGVSNLVSYHRVREHVHKENRNFKNLLLFRAFKDV